MIDVDQLAATSSNSVPILLLPPSEGKATSDESANVTGWSPADGTFGRRLGERRDEIVAALAALGGGDRKLLGVQGAHLERAQSANATLVGAPTLPAWRRYTGVVWDHLDPASLSAAERRRIVVVSGLSGLLRADDPVPDYRLKMGARLAPFGTLSTWWRDDLSETLNHYATGRTDTRRRFLVDLLPREHRAAWTPDHRVQGVSIDLVDPSGAPGGHGAKTAKGELAAVILRDGLGALAAWTDDRFELAIGPLI